MRIRPLTREDLLAVATIAADSFFDDELFATICPYRHEYPDACRRFWLERTRNRLMAPGLWGIVCVDGENEVEEIVGYALWQRTSTTSPPSASSYLQNNQDFFSRVERWLLAIHESYYFHIVRNPATDHAVAGMYRTPPSAISGMFGPLPDRWHLLSLAVAPGHRRKGIGQDLVQWGLDRCREEAPLIGGRSLPAVLLSSAVGQRMYSKMGFKVVAWYGQGSGTGGNGAMIWDEKNTWTRPVTAENGEMLKGGRPVEILFREKSLESGLGNAEKAAAASEMIEENAAIADGIDETKKEVVTEVVGGGGS